jgi:hypothetical protein
MYAVTASPASDGSIQPVAQPPYTSTTIAFPKLCITFPSSVSITTAFGIHHDQMCDSGHSCSCRVSIFSGCCHDAPCLTSLQRAAYMLSLGTRSFLPWVLNFCYRAEASQTHTFLSSNHQGTSTHQSPSRHWTWSNKPIQLSRTEFDGTFPSVCSKLKSSTS